MWNRCLVNLLVAGVMTASLVACKNDDDNPDPLPLAPNQPLPATYSIGGTATGLTGPMTLQNANGNQVTVPISGTFAFPTLMASGANYNVTVAVPPASQTCVVTNGTGTVVLSNISNVGVSCTTNAYTIGGTVSGLGAGKNVVLHAAADFISGNHAVFANGAFTFPLTFAANSEYVVEVFTQPADQTCSVANAQGDITTASVANVAVSCIDNSASARDWTPAQPIATDDDLADEDTMGHPQVGYDAAGNAIAVWESSRPTDLGNDVSFSRRAPGGAWSAPVILPRFVEPTLGYPLVENRREPRLAVAANGNAVVVWRALVASIGWDLGVSFYNATNNTWSAPEYAFTSAADNPQGAGLHKVSMDASGNVLVVFEDFGVLRYNRYSPGSGWVMPADSTQIVGALDPTMFAREPTLAMNANGDAVAVWRQRYQLDTFADYYLYSSRYDMGTDSWTAPQPVDRAWNDPEAEEVFYRYNVVVDAAGVATAVWSRYDGTRLHVVSNRLTGNTWATPIIVETDNTGQSGNAIDPRAAIDGAGNVMAMWLQNDRDDGHYVANRYVPGTGWGTQQIIGDYHRVGFGAEFTEMELVSNASGDTVALWTLYSEILPENQLGPYEVFANEYNGTTHQWGVPTVIDKEDTESTEEFGEASDIAVAIDVQGNAAAVWKDLGSPETGIRSSQFE
jgi:hypothetical protein